MKQSSRGFTLIELSIVIIIIGFLIASILIGSNINKQAKLRGFITELSLYQTSYNNFITKYSKIPGDMDNAFALWGTKCAASAALCNGNNDSIINLDKTSATNNEANKAMKHLQLAGMISDDIEPVSSTSLMIGVTIPASKAYTKAGYVLTGNTKFIKNVINFGINDNAGTTVSLAALTPEDTFHFDQKIDDGIIDTNGNFTGGLTGNFRGMDGNASTTGSCTNIVNGHYNIANSGVVSCKIKFLINNGNL